MERLVEEIMGYYEMTGEEFVSQVDSLNRERDRTRVVNTLGIAEEGNPETVFYSRKSRIQVAVGYLRVVYGDHGPYIEFDIDQITKGIWRHRKKGPNAWYDEAYLAEVDDPLMVYVQKKSVHMLPNPPAGKYSCRRNRVNGYADYRVQRLYVSPDDVSV
jgi:hypothetical protein